MSTMNISLPDALKAFVDQQVTARGYGTSSEYVRELIRKDLELQKLKGLMIDAAASPVVQKIDASYFQSLRDQVQRSQAS
jgi:antitoxin ParD1/3/4